MKAAFRYITGANLFIIICNDVSQVDDACTTHTTHKELYDSAIPKEFLHRQFEVYPRGPLPDVWRFSYVDSSSVQHDFKFERNSLSKEGKIYKNIKGENTDLVAEFKSESSYLFTQIYTSHLSNYWLIVPDQKRYDSWLNAPQGVEVYTVSCVEDAPKVCP